MTEGASQPRWAVKPATAERRVAAWIPVASGAGGLAFGWWIGLGPGPHFSGWWNDNAGFATFVTGIIAGGATLLYVLLTRRLVQEGQQGLAATREANQLTREALEEDRALVAISLRNRLDGMTPVVALRAASPVLRRTNDLSIGVIDWAAFLETDLWIRLTFIAVNHGPSPARLSLRSAPQDCLWSMERTDIEWTEPLILSPGSERTLTLNIAAPGTLIAGDWTRAHEAGEPVVAVEFASEGLIPVGVQDVHHHWVTFAAVPSEDGVFHEDQSFQWLQSGRQLNQRREYPESS